MGIFDRIRGKKREPDVPATLASVLSEAQLDELRETAREWIRAGFHDKVNLPTELADYRDDFEVEAEVVLRAAAGIVDEEWATRLAEQQTWSGDSDYDRVQRAFEALGEQGIVARMNFTCCQTCGTAEIDDERTPLDEPGDDYPFREWGYTFFHQQDSERLADSPSDLYLSYGAFIPAADLDEKLRTRARDADDDARRDVVRRSDEAVGTAIADTLRAEGLEVEWNGSSDSRVQVSITDWRKPLPSAD